MTDPGNPVLFFVPPRALPWTDAPPTPEEQAALDEINRRVAASESLDAILVFLLEAVRGIAPCDRIGLAFFEENGRRAVAHAVHARYEPLFLKSGYAQNLAGSSLEPILRGGQVRIINDLELYLREHPESVSTKLLVREGVRSNMTCPLKVEGRAIGVLFRSSRCPLAYDERQARLHFLVAERLSQAVEKVWQIEQLKAANHAYLELLGFISHELKNPLAAMIGGGRLLTGGYLGEVPPRQLEWAGRVVRKAEYLLGLIRQYLDLSRIESGAVQPHFSEGVHPLEDLVRPSLDLLKDQIDEKKVTVKLEVPEIPGGVACDPELIKIVLVNLIGNGIKYGNEPGEIRLACAKDEHGFECRVWNAGPGFAEAEHNSLFRKFSRLSAPELARRKGTGLGLYNCWRILQLHNGTIAARSEPGHWAEFTFRIPPRP